MRENNSHLSKNEYLQDRIVLCKNLCNRFSDRNRYKIVIIFLGYRETVSISKKLLKN